MMPPLVVVTGPAGVGKSTAAGALARTFELGVHLRVDDFGTHEHIAGNAAAAATFTFVGGGYAVVLDGILFPDGIAGLADACVRLGVPMHVAVLRADVDTCLARAEARAPLEDREAVAALHRRFEDVGPHESQVLDASADADEVAALLVDAFRTGRLVEVEPRAGWQD